MTNEEHHAIRASAERQTRERPESPDVWRDLAQEKMLLGAGTLEFGERSAQESSDERQGMFLTGYRGAVSGVSPMDEAYRPKIGIWVAESASWARGYAERKVARTGGKSQVQEVSYVLLNPLELGDIEEPSIDDVLQELSDDSGIPFETLCELRHDAGWSGQEFEEPCLFEITNTPKFIDLSKSRGFDGMIGWENGDTCRVDCIFEKKSILSVKDVTDTIPDVEWSDGCGAEGMNICRSE